MGLYNFQQRFADYILDGTKKQTVRSLRKYPQKVGGKMHLYKGSRTKPVMIIEPQICSDVKTIVLFEDETVWLINAVFAVEDVWLYKLYPNDRHKDPKLKGVQHKELTEAEKDAFAWADGFRGHHLPAEKAGCFKLMLEWLKQSKPLPLVLHVMYWK